MTRLLEGTTNRVAITSYLRIKYSFKAGKQFLIIHGQDSQCWGRRLTINRCEAVNIWCQSVRMSGCRVLHYTKHFLQNEFSAPEIWNNLIIIIAATLASQCPDLAQFPSRSTFIQNNGGKKWKKGKNLSFWEYLYQPTDIDWAWQCRANETIFSEETDGWKILFTRNTSSSPLKFFS